MKSNKLWVIALAGILLFTTGFGMAQAADESVWTILYINIGAQDEMTVTLLDESAETSSPGGTQAANNLEFNSSTGHTLWQNATVIGGSEQDNTNAILEIDNTGNTNLNVSLVLGNASNACNELRYDLSFQSDVETDGKLLNDSTPAIIDTSFAPGDAAKDVWLWCNFTACAADDDNAPLLFINASTA